VVGICQGMTPFRAVALDDWADQSYTCLGAAREDVKGLVLSPGCSCRRQPVRGAVGLVS